jgi:hypothetical protein
LQNLFQMTKIQKIPLQDFITILQDLYEEGVNFIDISGGDANPDSDQIKDMIKITVKPEYMEEDDDDYDDEDNTLSEKDINDLI